MQNFGLKMFLKNLSYKNKSYMTLTSLNQYGTNCQIKVISSLLTHKQILTNIHDIISDDSWDNKSYIWII